MPVGAVKIQPDDSPVGWSRPPKPGADQQEDQHHDRSPMKMTAPMIASACAGVSAARLRRGASAHARARPSGLQGCASGHGGYTAKHWATLDPTHEIVCCFLSSLPELWQESHEARLVTCVELLAFAACSDLRFGAATYRTRGSDLFSLPRAISVSLEGRLGEDLLVRA